MSVTTQKIVTFTAPKEARLLSTSMELPRPAPDEVVGKTICSLISPGTELNAGFLGDSFPHQPGYAAVCQLTAVGNEVQNRSVGDTVLCTGPAGIGGHRQYQQCPVSATLPVPDGLDPFVAVHARLMNVTMAALATTRARPPMGVLILGLGPVGHLGARVFHAAGYRVTAVDPDPKRRAMAERKGIPTLAKVPSDDPYLRSHYTMAVDCSGHEQAVLDACWAIRQHGEIVLTGVPWRPTGNASAHQLLHAVFRNFLTLRSGWEWQIPRHPTPQIPQSVFTNIAGALDWLARKRIDLDQLYQLRPPEDCQRAYDDLLNHNLDSLTLLFDWR